MAEFIQLQHTQVTSRFSFATHWPLDHYTDNTKDIQYNKTQLNNIKHTGTKHTVTEHKESD